METTKMKNQTSSDTRDTKTAMPLRIKGDWNTMKSNLKQKFGNLTDNDLVFDQGKEEELVGRLQRALGKNHDEVVDIIQSMNDRSTTDRPTNDRSTNDRSTNDRRSNDPSTRSGVSNTNESAGDGAGQNEERNDENVRSQNSNSPRRNS